MKLVHHHLIYQAKVGREPLGFDSELILKNFMYELLDLIEMQELIPAKFKFSEQKAWTGLMGIVTSHISFHYWTIEKYIQLDIYSCKEFDREKAVKFLNGFWCASDVKILFIDRKVDAEFEVVGKNF